MLGQLGIVVMKRTAVLLKNSLDGINGNIGKSGNGGHGPIIAQASKNLAFNGVGNRAVLYQQGWFEPWRFGRSRDR